MTPAAPRQAFVNQTLVASYLGSADAVGQHVTVTISTCANGHRDRRISNHGDLRTSPVAVDACAVMAPRGTGHDAEQPGMGKQPTMLHHVQQAGGLMRTSLILAMLVATAPILVSSHRTPSANVFVIRDVRLFDDANNRAGERCCSGRQDPERQPRCCRKRGRHDCGWPWTHAAPPASSIVTFMSPMMRTVLSSKQ